MRKLLNIAVFASGRGSNFASILRAIEKGNLQNVSISVVISSSAGAPVLEIARTHNIPTYHLAQKQFPSEAHFDEAVLHVLHRHDVNFIVLAGYMKKLSANLVQKFHNRILNIHPALLPDFGGKAMYGVRVHEAVINSGTKMSGATVHIVDEEYDHGPIVKQHVVPVADDETPETLATKVHEIEHQLYPEVLQLFADDRVQVEKGRVMILDNGRKAC